MTTPHDGTAPRCREVVSAPPYWSSRPCNRPAKWLVTWNGRPLRVCGIHVRWYGSKGVEPISLAAPGVGE